MMNKRLIFVSSVQKELAPERRAVHDYVRGDALLRRYFDVFLFEDLPATDRRPDDLYLDKVDKCTVYLGILGNEYGSEDAQGISPTEREFDRATKRGKYRLLFVKGNDDKARHPKMRKLMGKAQAQLVRRRFIGTPDLITELYDSLVQYLDENGLLSRVPFDEAPCTDASMRDISNEKLAWFLEQAHRERQYPLTKKALPEQALAHLDLLSDGKPKHAAILLFGKNPQHFVRSAEVKCLHFHGTTVQKPIPSYQIYKRTTFDQVDQAVDFVMSKLTRSVGTRAKGPAAPVEYDLPKEAVAEAIVNAVTHRDYTSNSAVQVMIFADRLEVWNPGELPAGLTPEGLRIEHPSIPRNPLICDPMYLAHYIEKAGTGTLDMIARCREAGLPEPSFEQRGGQFVTTLWRSWLTTSVFAGLDLNDRQRAAVNYLQSNHRMGNLDYQKLTGAIKKTASRDLDDLVQKEVLRKVGRTGRGTYYVLARKGDKKGTKRTSQTSGSKGTKRGQRRPASKSQKASKPR
jgi:predicted HTH transcriptional regulator